MTEDKSVFLEIFGDSPILRVLDFLVVNEEFDYSMTDIAKLSGVGYSTLKLFWQKFEDDGNYIEVLHKHDEISEYEHLRQHSSRVKVGDKVLAGDILAEVGNTGWSECPHLHFMIYPKDNQYKTLEIQFKKERG